MISNYPSELLDFYEINKTGFCQVKNTFVESQLDTNCSFYPIIFNFNTEIFLKECISLDHLFCDHRSFDTNYGSKHSGWKSITLHGIDSTKTEHYTQYGFSTLKEANYQWTDVCELVPNLYQFLKNLPFKQFDRVRIMRLAPGGFIMPHSDGPGRIFSPLNIAINQPDECYFVFEGAGIVPFKAGTGMVLDVARKHAVINFSNEVRYHVIVHGHYNNQFYKL
jgi:hypothetical protein